MTLRNLKKRPPHDNCLLFPPSWSCLTWTRPSPARSLGWPRSPTSAGRRTWSTSSGEYQSPSRIWSFYENMSLKLFFFFVGWQRKIIFKHWDLLIQDFFEVENLIFDFDPGRAQTSLVWRINYQTMHKMQSMCSNMSLHTSLSSRSSTRRFLTMVTISCKQVPCTRYWEVFVHAKHLIWTNCT